MRSLAWLVPAFVLTASLPAVAADSPVAFRFADQRITESSGLVDTGTAMFTVNDSGNPPVVFRLDPRTGRTLGATRYAEDNVDVEALAPAGGDSVWVGDIGDNARSRAHVEVYRVEVGTGERTVRAERYRLAYPGGPRDAETLLAGAKGELYVVTKSLIRGEVYRARDLVRGKPQVLTKVADVGRLITDGAVMPDGRHVLLRNYGQASVYTFPDFEYVGAMALPSQRQGEGLSVSPQGRIRLSSEGLHAPVLEVRLTPRLMRAMAPGTTAPSTSPSDTPSESVAARADSAEESPAPADRRMWVAAAGVLGLVVLAGAGMVIVRRRR